jgi:hypothetical protein
MSFKGVGTKWETEEEAIAAEDAIAPVDAEDANPMELVPAKAEDR